MDSKNHGSQPSPGSTRITHNFGKRSSVPVSIQKHIDSARSAHGKAANMPCCGVGSRRNTSHSSAFMWIR